MSQHLGILTKRKFKLTKLQEIRNSIIRASLKKTFITKEQMMNLYRTNLREKLKNKNLKIKFQMKKYKE